MRALIRHFDAWLCRAYGVFEFSDDENCVLRLQVTRAPHTLHLNGQVVDAGASVLALHLWNEHIPPMPPAGTDLAWAALMKRLLIQSFRSVATQMRCDPRLASVRAVGGVMALLSPAEHPAGMYLMRRLGFTVMPYHSPLGHFGEFWENLYSWWIMWTFNAASLQHRQLVHLCRTEVWMLVEEFLSRYGMQ
jgi:YkoP domain